MNDNEETLPPDSKFDPSTFPDGTLFHERRWRQRRDEPTDGTPAAQKPERRAKKERRRRIDPTTFEKQYTQDELEFMNAMQRYKVQSGKSFPTHSEVLKVAFQLGYRKVPGDDIKATDANSKELPRPHTTQGKNPLDHSR